jgi:hypothetical protein
LPGSVREGDLARRQLGRIAGIQRRKQIPAFDDDDHPITAKEGTFAPRWSDGACSVAGRCDPVATAGTVPRDDLRA